MDSKSTRWEATARAASAGWLLCSCEASTLDLDDPEGAVAPTGVVLGLDDTDAPVATGEQYNWDCADGEGGTDGSLSAPPEPLTLTVDIVDFDAVGDPVVPGLGVVGCGRLDTLCTRPQTLEMRTTDEPWRYSFTLPFQWESHMLLSAPGYADTLYAIDGSLRTSRRGDVAEMFPTATHERLLADLGEVPEPSRGLLLLRILDCDNNRVPSAAVETSRPDAAVFHLIDGEAVPGEPASDSNGAIGFRIPAGFVLVEGFVKCVNGALPRERAVVSYRLHAGGGLPVADRFDYRPVCDSNGEARIGRTAVLVMANGITAGEIRPGRL